RVRFDVDDVGFYLATQLAGAVTKTFWAPLQEKQILVAADSTENHRFYDRMGLRTFYVPDAGTQQELQDLTNVLRTVFEIKFVSSNVAKSTLTVRAPQNILNAATQFLATFGGGKTLMGVSLGTLGATLSRSESQLRSLQHVTVRAAQGKDATMNLGSRYPIINASFAPIFNTAAISQVIANNSFIAPVPSFTYEDIGITLKVKPVVHGDTDVSMNIELKVRSLTVASANGVPVI